jgi:ABC-type sugar transport system substrate-binding protein
MVASPAIAVLFAVLMVFACAETAAAKAARARHPAASHSSKVAQRTKPPVAHAPPQVDNGWMERASAPSNGGGGGGM